MHFAVRRRLAGSFGLMTLTGFLALHCWTGPVTCNAQVNLPPAVPAEAASHVEEALFQEIYGQNAARFALLEHALEQSPDSAEVRWQLGQIQVGREWLSLDTAAQQARTSSTLAEYAERREACPDTAAGHEQLARWCDRQGLSDRGGLHWQIVLSLDPSNRAAVAQLGLVRSDGIWVTREALDEFETRQEGFARAERQWRPRLAEWRRAILWGTAEERDQALAQLYAIDDVWVLPTLEDEFSSRGGELAEVAVGVLADIRHPWATESLVRHAVLSEDEEVREAATALLKERSPYEYVPLLLDSLIAPLEAEFTVQVDPNGGVNLRRWLRLEDRDAIYTTTVDRSLFLENTQPVAVPVVRWDSEGTPYAEYRDNRRAQAITQMRRYSLVTSTAQIAHETAAAAEGAVQAYNLAAEALNTRIGAVLAETSGEDQLSSPLEWWKWWDELNDIEYGGEKPQVEGYSMRFASYAVPLECFAAGTPVWTELGLKPIETIQIGDRVLSQDIDTGELAFKIVTGCTVRPSTQVVSILTSGERITSTPSHLFWANGSGWRKVRNLQSGDLLHGTGGAEFVSEVVTCETHQVVYNLIVDEHHNYFVGESRVLVHDGTIPQPTQAIVPGLLSQ